MCSKITFYLKKQFIDLKCDAVFNKVKNLPIF